MDDDEKIGLVILAVIAVLAFLFLVPIQDGNTVLTVENGTIESPIGEEDGDIGDLGGDDGGDDDGTDGGTDNETQGEPCTYPESFDMPTRSWWFVGQRCPDRVTDFFDRADEVDCFEIESTGNPYEYRNEITDWYNDYLLELNWERVDVESGYVNREEWWVWGGLYYCEYSDKGMIVLFGFCPATTSRTGQGAFGQAVGDWDYMKDRADEIEELVEYVMD
jgi:hypothetical protein